MRLILLVTHTVSTLRTYLTACSPNLDKAAINVTVAKSQDHEFLHTWEKTEATFSMAPDVDIKVNRLTKNTYITNVEGGPV